MAEQNFWGEKTVHIDGNPLLQDIANHILRLVERDKTLLDADKIGIAVKKITLAIWKDDGLANFLTEEQLIKFEAWFMSKASVEVESVGRASRYLASQDLIRFSSKAVVEAERERQRISQSVKK